ncbi:MAG: hypothetical protein HOA57_00705 [Candidatus Magasanikbacteria bacterium]|jgi:hypothetical protein|nr:hypothetical protein [Candidatus Magasanikbacteria bacterium]MBT4314538.1 hypothetical protein [Candidatus Magasanikbacteria bacterium]MBT4547436.1 hypothetical protein [Candidatus Magasanikbacteria bacterium]MBT6818892.1 hypothetical protein [Candidatus Magasanikbacteria bacterium]
MEGSGDSAKKAHVELATKDGFRIDEADEERIRKEGEVGDSAIQDSEQRFDPGVYSALKELGFRLTRDEKKVIEKPKYIKYKTQSRFVTVEVDSLLIKEEELLSGAPALVFKVDGGERKVRLPVTSRWFARATKKE